MNIKAKTAPVPKANAVPAVVKPLKTKKSVDAAPVASLPVAAPAALKIKDIKKSEVYVLQNMNSSAYDGRLVMVETSAIVNGRRAFVMKIQNWSKKELSKGICNLVSVDVTNLRLATNEDQGINTEVLGELLEQAQIVVAYLERVTGIKAVIRNVKKGKAGRPVESKVWDLEAISKDSNIRYDLAVSIQDNNDIDVYGNIYVTKGGPEVDIDVCLTDANAVIAAIKKQMLASITPLNTMIDVLNKFF